MKNYAKIAWVWFKRKTMLTYAATVILVATLYLWGPYVEVNAFPVLTGLRVTQVHRVVDPDGDSHACFAISFKKEKFAIAKYVVFLAVTSTGEQYDTRVMVAEHGKMRPFLTYQDKVIRPTGTVGTYYWCVQIPRDIEGLTLSGKIQYSTWHRQWDLDQPLPTITVPFTDDKVNTEFGNVWPEITNKSYENLKNRSD